MLEDFSYAYSGVEAHHQYIVDGEGVP